MFTPEFIITEAGNYVLVANHSVETVQALEQSIAFNRARTEYAKAHLPKHIDKCILVYDLRGQKVPPGTVEKLHSVFSDLFEVSVKS